jgi:hypothetical protein
MSPGGSAVAATTPPSRHSSLGSDGVGCSTVVLVIESNSHIFTATPIFQNMMSGFPDVTKK